MIWYYSDIEKRFKAESTEYSAVVMQVLDFWMWQLRLKNANGSMSTPLVNRRLRCRSVQEAQTECERVYQAIRNSRQGLRDSQHAQFVDAALSTSTQ